jgi:hypothetical protein
MRFASWNRAECLHFSCISRAFLVHFSWQRDFLLLLLLFDCILLFFLFLSNVLTTSSVHYCVCITDSFFVVVLVYCSSLSFLSLENTPVFVFSFWFSSPSCCFWAPQLLHAVYVSWYPHLLVKALVRFWFVFFPRSTVGSCVCCYHWSGDYVVRSSM